MIAGRKPGVPESDVAKERENQAAAQANLTEQDAAYLRERFLQPESKCIYVIVHTSTGTVSTQNVQ